MWFTSAEKMLEYIQNDNDLYSPEKTAYVFKYSEDGKIAVYTGIGREGALELNKVACESCEYWGSILGIGGRVYDDPLEWCKDNFEGTWIDVTDYVPDLEKQLDNYNVL